MSHNVYPNDLLWYIFWEENLKVFKGYKKCKNWYILGYRMLYIEIFILITLFCKEIMTVLVTGVFDSEDITQGNTK